MPKVYYWEAIQQALRFEMERDPRVFLVGEDIGVYGGAFKVTRGMLADFGPERVMDSPISEAGLAGLCAGAAMTGLRPVTEVMFMDFITLMFDQLLNHAAKYRYMYGGTLKVPMVVRAPSGGGRGYGATHSQALESYMMKIPGIKVVAPAFCEDARGLLISAIRDDNPVIFIEHKRLYGTTGEVAEAPTPTPIGEARLVRKGNDLTLISYSYMTHVCLTAAEALEAEGVSCSVLDLRTLSPLDAEAIAAAVADTGRVIVVEEGTRTAGVGAEVCARICESSFFDLECPPVRVATPDCHIPCSPPLENALLPRPAAVLKAAREMMAQ